MSTQSSENKRKQPRNLAARAGRWSAKHRRVAIVGWFAFVILAVYAGGQIGQQEISDIDQYNGESRVAEELIAGNFAEDPAMESLIVESEKYRVGDPEYDSVLKSITTELAAQPKVDQVRSPLTRDGPVVEDGHTSFVQFTLKGDVDDSPDLVEPIANAVKKIDAENSAVTIGQYGDGSFEMQFEEAMSGDLERARNLSLPITLIILIFAFGALVAAGIPVLLAVTAVAATLGLIAVPSQIFPVDEAISEVVLLIGMAVGVDYSLFYLKREREERAAGRGERAALEAAAATSGRAVLISGFIVIVAMSGMFITGSPTFTSFAIGTIMVVLVAMVGSLTVLPALLAALGDKVDRGRIPFLGKRRQRAMQRGETGGVWTKIVNVVLRAPAVSAFVAAAIMVALAIPAFQLDTGNPGPESFPKDMPAVQAYLEASEKFPSENMPAVVVVKADDVRKGDAAAAIGDFKQRLADSEAYSAPTEDDIEVSKDGTVAKIDVPLVNATNEEQAERDVQALRSEYVADVFGSVPGVTVATTGDAASSIDFDQLMNERLPLVFAFVLGLAFLLLLVTFRSVVIPVVSILLNLLSVAAAYGVIVLVFQHGWMSGLLGFEGTHAIVPWLPLFMFVVLFGLSMDYHVFILSRIREAYDSGMSNDEAVRRGISVSAGVITSAAIVMVAVFSIFASLSFVMFKQMGVGLAAAILLDATIVRAVLLPAVMKLLGDANWYLPKWMGWLPQVEIERGPEATTRPATEAAV